MTRLSRTCDSNCYDPPRVGWYGSTVLTTSKPCIPSVLTQQAELTGNQAGEDTRAFNATLFTRQKAPQANYFLPTH